MPKVTLNPPVGGVLKRYVEKDRLSSRLEAYLEHTHEFFSSVESINFDDEDFSGLLEMMNDTAPDNRRKLSLVANNVISTSDELKSHLFMLEKVILNSLDKISSLNQNIIDESKSSENSTKETEEDS